MPPSMRRSARAGSANDPVESQQRAPSNATAATTSLSLEHLVRIFVESKRSLRATEFVMRANVLVSCARNKLEKIVTMRAANAAQSMRLNALVANSKATCAGLAQFVEVCDEEFRDLLLRLDDLRSRVEDQLNRLKIINLPEALLSQTNPRTSLDRFIDEGGLVELDRDFKDTIDLTNEALDNMNRANDEFDVRVKYVESQLHVVNTGFDHLAKCNAARSYRTIDDHAHSMARHLRELVNHYDHCLLALRNTEGAGEALDGVDVPGGMDPVELDRAPDPPKNHDEYLQILEIIAADGAEVEQVVEDIKLRHQVLEDQVRQLDQLMLLSSHQENKMREIRAALDNLDESATSHIATAKAANERWIQLQDRFKEKMIELDDLQEFYDQFLVAYEALLEEMRRRSEARILTQSVAARAQSELRKLHKAEVHHRAEFAAAYGQHLPMELWNHVGGNDAPVEHRITAVKLESKLTSEIPTEVWQGALQSLQASKSKLPHR